MSDQYTLPAIEPGEPVDYCRHLAAAAARRIADGEPLDTIETEPLAALCDWLIFELQDRDRRATERAHELVRDLF